jgi:hypothetical protein
VDVELEAVSAKRQAGVEGRHRVLGRERAAASMREDERAPARKKRMSQTRGQSTQIFVLR